MPQNGNEVAYGTCDGTGAKINVCLGFIPKRVKVWNVDSANFEVLEWQKENGLVASYADEGRLTRKASTADATTKLAVASGAQQGVREYAGGDVLTYDGVTNNRWEYGDSSADASEVFVDGHYQRTAASDAAYQCYGDRIDPNPRNGMKITTPPGFSIGADSNLNVDGEQLAWEAVR